MVQIYRKFLSQIKLCFKLASNLIFRRYIRSVLKSSAILALFLLVITQESGVRTPNHLSLEQRMSPESPLNLPYEGNFIYLNDKSNNNAKSLGGTSPIANYFQMIKSPTGVCRKLARFGGALECRHRKEKFPFMDGHKMICVDPEMEIFSSPNTEACNVLSFGISRDSSFDLSIRDANCQVHMFDILNYDPKYNESFMSFHQVGLSSENVFLYAAPYNTTVEVNTLDFILWRYNISNKINILKMDIEEEEWKVFDYLLKNNLLSSIGQISVEIHLYNALNKTDQADANVRKINQVLSDLENEGFRRVIYWDNEGAEVVKGEAGKEAGELLLVNSNWYNR